METENKVLTYAMAFATVSAGVLILSESSGSSIKNRRVRGNVTIRDGGL